MGLVSANFIIHGSKPINGCTEDLIDKTWRAGTSLFAELAVYLLAEKVPYGELYKEGMPTSRLKLL